MRSPLAIALYASLLPFLADAQVVDQSYLDLIQWRSIGPSRGGRVVAVAGDPVDEMTFYQGTTGGGVWKTDDGGLNWRNISDGYVRTGSVGAVAVAPSDPSIVYVGMGEACIRGNASHGDGVYMSSDAGETWSHLGLEPTLQIARIRVHPSDPNLVYVAALGDAWGPSEHRGVYRSRDGGGTWEKILYRDENTGAIDLAMHPTDPNTMYASLLELRRFPWGFRSAGEGTGLFKTVDGGDTWTELTSNEGLPEGLKGRIGITVSPANPDRLWAIVDAENGKKGLFRSDDAGATWMRLTDDADLLQRPWYYHHVFADPKDENTVYVLNVFMWKSTDGGETFQRMLAQHLDNHDLWIDPDDPSRMINGNDGGATVSFNGGRTWSTLLNQPTAQLYHASVDNAVPYRVYGSQQDNSSISVPSRSPFGRITIEDWYTVGGGEDGSIAVNTADPDIVYAADHHFIYRYDHGNKQVRDISPNPETHYGWGSADINYRFWWTFPVVTSPHDPSVLYVTSQHVHRTTNEGESWEIISPDLTRADPSTLENTPTYASPETGEYWGPITREAYGPEWYATIFAFAESPVQQGLMWAGSDDGLIHVSNDGGQNWANVTIDDLPEFAMISIIDPSPHDPGTAYVAATRYKLSDRQPYLYKTTNFGESWTKITNGIPDGDFTRVIREDPIRPGLLYAGTETGVYVSFDAGGNWRSLSLNLPVVPVHDLVVKDGDLVAATHGRSFWILDNVELLAQLDDRAVGGSKVLFKPRTAIRFREGSSAAAFFNDMANFLGPDPTGQNPSDGVVIPYYLEEEPTGEVTLRILDGGETIASFSNQGETAGGGEGIFGGSGGSRTVPANEGANRFVWNMRYPGAEVLDNAVFQGSSAGPLAPPATYTVELTVDGEILRQQFEIVKDPGTEYSNEVLQEQFEFLISVRDKMSETMGLVGRMRELRNDAMDRVVAAGDGGNLAQAMNVLNDKLYPLEERLVQYRARAGQDLIAQPTGVDSKLGRLLSFASMADGPPTQGQRNLFERLSTIIAEHAEALEEVEQNEYAELVRMTGGLIP